MTHHQQAARKAARRTLSTLAAATVVGAVLLGAASSSVDLPGAEPTAAHIAPEGPGEVGLDPALLDALHRAADDADVEFVITSGRRSAAYQDRLLREAVVRYGSEAEAARWVATPETSAHVSGDAVDLGPAAAAWLSEHGAAYGLCRIYRNEPWHYELRPAAVRRGCPPLYADPTHDPRMQ